MTKYLYTKTIATETEAAFYIVDEDTCVVLIQYYIRTFLKIIIFSCQLLIENS